MLTNCRLLLRIAGGTLDPWNLESGITCRPTYQWCKYDMQIVVRVEFNDQVIKTRLHFNLKYVQDCVFTLSSI